MLGLVEKKGKQGRKERRKKKRKEERKKGRNKVEKKEEKRKKGNIIKAITYTIRYKKVIPYVALLEMLPLSVYHLEKHNYFSLLISAKFSQYLCAQRDRTHSSYLISLIVCFKYL